MNSQDYLLIEGETIWVRATPVTGKVVMKLNTDDNCKVLKCGIKDTIRGNIDFWYHIEFDDQKGWVFGSQTSIKSEETKQIQSFEKQFANFINAVEENDFETMNKFIHPKYGYYYIFRPGVMDGYSNHFSFEEKFNSEYSALKILAEMYSKKKPKHKSFNKILRCCCQFEGFFTNNAKIDCTILSRLYERMLVFLNPQMEDELTEEQEKELQQLRNIEHKTEKTIILSFMEEEEGYNMCEEKYTVSISFSFLRDGLSWYLIIVDTNDCFGA